MAGRLDKKNIKRGISYLKRNGLSSAYYKAAERLTRDRDEAGYTQRVVSSMLTEREIDKQLNTDFEKPYLISILVPAYKTEEYLMRELLKSVCTQTYTGWELIIADASPDDSVKIVIDRFIDESEKHSGSGRIENGPRYGDIRQRIRYYKLEENGGISVNTNAALSYAKGDYIAFLDHDDVLVQDALYEIMSVLNGQSYLVDSAIHKQGDIKFIYSDEDKVSYDGLEYFDLHSKTDYDPAMLLTNNYICHLCVVSRELVSEVGGLNPEFDGSQDFDFVLRCCEKLSDEEIVHIPKVLYHWRSSAASTAENPEAKMYAYEAGKRAIEASLGRRGIKASVSATEHLGFFKVEFADIDGSVKLITDSEFAAMNEKAFSNIAEDYIMVLSDELKPRADYIKSLKNVMVLPYVGAVTGKITSGGRIESAGYCVHRNRGVTPYFAGLNEHYSGYMHRASLLRSVEAYDNGCVMLKKSALRWNGDGPVLMDGYRCVYLPTAIYRRKRG